MATTIKIKRGLKTNLPTLAVGEMGYCTDTNELFIGTTNGNELINEDSTINALGDIGDVNVSNLSEGDILIYDGTNWVNRVETPTILGVEWDQDTDSLTRLDDAVGLTAGGDFDSFNHYQLRRCMVNDDLSINYYIDPDDPTKIGEVVNTGTYTTGNNADYTGSHGQVMVEIPKFWWKYDEPTSDQYQWRIRNTAQAGYNVHPAFITDGVTKDYIYMSAFESGIDGIQLTSVSGVSVVTDDSTLYNTDEFPSNVGNGLGTLPDHRIAAQNRGTGWQLQTYWGTHALQMLYLIEYADFDSQTTIGRGRVDKNLSDADAALVTGDTISLGNASGMASGTDGLSAISYRGIENWWGNITTWVDGINIDFQNVYVSNENFNSLDENGTMPSGYTLIGTVPNTSGYINDILFPHFLPLENTGSSTTFLHDKHFRGLEEEVADFGGNWFRDDVAGGFHWALQYNTNGSLAWVGSRLQIL